MTQHPLLHHLLTPMAAPETKGLRRMRLLWIISCALLGTGAGGIRPWTHLAGLWASAVVAALLATTLILGFIYLRTKNRADAAWAALDYQP
jgi:hypothetical protein